MSAYVARVEWRRNGQDFLDDRYSRAHEWAFDGGVTVPASASPHIVPLPFSVAENVDPEEAFVASLSSCHMLFFLSLAARRGIVIDEYVDEAEGYLEKAADGKLTMTRVILRPRQPMPAMPRPMQILSWLCIIDRTNCVSSPIQ